MNHTEQITREKKKAEAVARMRQIGIFPETIAQFEQDGYISQSLPPVGACFWIEGEQLQRVKEFEEEYNAVVYFVIHAVYDFSGEAVEMESYLYVSDYEEEWSDDREDLANGQTLAYVQNLSWPECSEFGSIGIALTPAAGLKRTW